MGTAYFADLVEKFGGAHYALASYNAGPAPRRALDGRASGPRARRVHRRHPVSRDAELREENPRHGRGLPPAVRDGRRCRPTTRCRPRPSRPPPATPRRKRPRRRRRRSRRRKEESRRGTKSHGSARPRRVDHVQAHRIEESHAVHRVGHPRDDAAQPPVRRRQPLAGISRFSGAAGDQGSGVRRDQRRRQPVRGDVGRAPAARGDRARVHAPLRPADRRRRAGHRLLRLDRSDDVDDDGDHRSGRRGRHLRAVLRELRARRDSVRRDAALRHACTTPPTGRSIPTSSRRRSTTGPRRSSSTRRTTRRARCSRATSSR